MLLNLQKIYGKSKEKKVGLAKLEPKQIQSSKSGRKGPPKRNPSLFEIVFRFFYSHKAL